MRSRDRQRLDSDWSGRFETWVDRLYMTRIQLPGLLRGMTYGQIRQLIKLLRAGKIGSGDVRISPQMMAEVLEQTIDDNAMAKWAVATLGGHDDKHRAMEERYARERERSRVAGFHELKNRAVEEGPDSAAAERFRQASRGRRNALGRQRRGKNAPMHDELPRRPSMKEVKAARRAFNQSRPSPACCWAPAFGQPMPLAMGKRVARLAKLARAARPRLRQSRAVAFLHGRFRRP